MKVNELWLKDFVKTDLSAKALAEQLTNGGIEVDALEYPDPKDRNAQLTFKIPPNRGDCLGVEGLSREMACLTGSDYLPLVVGDSPIQSTATFPVELKAPKACSQYVGCVVENIDNQITTPDWMIQRLETAGIRSVSAVVDVMNYVMLELGQPLHAFDLTTLSDKLIVRFADRNETIELLDEQKVTLQEKTLVIADSQKAQAIAGVMGGLGSSVQQSTTSIFIESAYFDPVTVRLAGQAYGMKTDALYRFERGIDPELQHRALKRAVELLLSITGGQAGPLVEAKDKKHHPAPRCVYLRSKRITQLLGITPEPKAVKAFLEKAGMQVELDKEGFQVTAPSYRHDIVIEADLVEEIARFYGLHQLPSTPLKGVIGKGCVSEKHIPTEWFKTALLNRGYHEAITYSFVDPKWVALLDEASETLALQNPISSDLSVMRNSLWPGLLQAIQYNQHRQFSRVRLFEVGHAFVKEKDSYHERYRLAGMCSGSLYSEQWGVSTRAHDFYDVKNDIEALGAMSQSQLSFEQSNHPALHAGQTAKIKRGNDDVGYLGVLHPRIEKLLKLEGPIIAFELELPLLQKAAIPSFSSLSKFPTIRRDIAFIVDKKVSADQMTTLLHQTAGQFLQDVCIFDIYEGKGIDLNKKSVALSLIVGDHTRTLKEAEASELVDKIVSRLKADLGAVLRE